MCAKQEGSLYHFYDGPWYDENPRPTVWETGHANHYANPNGSARQGIQQPPIKREDLDQRDQISSVHPQYYKQSKNWPSN